MKKSKLSVITILSLAICLNTSAMAVSVDDIGGLKKLQSAECTQILNKTVTESGEEIGKYFDTATVIPYCATMDNTPTHFSTYVNSQFYKQLSDICGYYVLTKDKELFFINKDNTGKYIAKKEKDYPEHFKKFFDVDTLSELLDTVNVRDLSDIKIVLDYELGTFIMYLNTDKGEYIVLSNEVSGDKFLPDRTLEAFKMYTADEYVDFVKKLIIAQTEYHNAENEKETQEGYTMIDKTGDDIYVKATPKPIATDKPVVTPKPTKLPQNTENPGVSETPQITPTPTPQVAKFEKLIVKNGDKLSISLDNNELSFEDAKPFIDKNGRTQVPIYAFAEPMGLKLDWSVGWNGPSTAVLTSENGDVVKITIGNNVMNVNNREVAMDTEATIVDDRTYIPIRFVAEALGLTVEWR